LRFGLSNGHIEAESNAGNADSIPSAAERDAAEEWYRSIRATALAA
jgi:hypothetical protein